MVYILKILMLSQAFYGCTLHEKFLEKIKQIFLIGRNLLNACCRQISILFELFCCIESLYASFTIDMNFFKFFVDFKYILWFIKVMVSLDGNFEIKANKNRQKNPKNITK